MSEQPAISGVTEELLIRRSHLPHWQAGGSVYFVTFNSKRGPLPPEALRLVVEHILFDHGKRYDLVFAVVMPAGEMLVEQCFERGAITNHQRRTLQSNKVFLLQISEQSRYGFS